MDNPAPWLDPAIAAVLPWLGAWILVSGVDDLVILGSWLIARWRGEMPVMPTVTQLASSDHKHVAIFVPCWKEAEVIAGMLRHNLAAIAYDRFEFFVGAYPNDEATVRALEEVEAREPRVHLALVPHDGPTCKADCLNWIYQRMLLHEEESGERFDLVLMHDAEDIMHPEELRVVNWFARLYGFIQTPVLPMATPAREWVHGLYIDDFTEFHTKDLPARWWLGGFVPSSGVGTAMRRDALEALAASSSNQIFEPGSLTEDYELGYRIRALGVNQLFVPVERPVSRELPPLATREFFPTTFYTALRQRTRWVTGITLQGMERHGVGKTLAETWWFMRDRKGLIGNPLSVFANLIFLYGVAGWVLAQANGWNWRLGEMIRNSVPLWMIVATAAVGSAQLGVRTWLTARMYGWRLARWTPLRSWAGNFLNGASTICAIHRYCVARWTNRPLVWLKTSHNYPSLEALRSHKRPIEELLVARGYVVAEAIEQARASLPEGLSVVQYLMQQGILSDEQLLETLSVQHGVETANVDVTAVRRELARSLPVRIARQFQVMPFALVNGELQLASPHVPPEECRKEIGRHTALNLRVVLVTQRNFQQLCDELL